MVDQQICIRVDRNQSFNKENLSKKETLKGPSQLFVEEKHYF